MDAMIESVRRARGAGRKLAALGAEGRRKLLADFADALRDPATRAAIEAANRDDMAAAKQDEAAGRLASALVKRLALDASKLATCEEGLRQLSAMGDLVGEVTVHRLLDDGLVLKRESCPLGVVGVVFEARPDALVQIIGLAWKSGNALVAKGGREAVRTNRAIVEAAHATMRANGLDVGALLLLEDRREIQELLGMHDDVDLMIARGSASFIHYVRANTRIPVMSHADGICHVYLHGAYDAEKAARLVVDAKCDYPAACNAVETLLWDDAAAPALDACVRALERAGVELRGCPATRALHPAMKAATDDDWDTEYGAPILSVKKVAGLDEALDHVARHGSRHTDAIVTSDEAAAKRFLAEVDSACVFWNASTRFADGYRFGLGAEVGIGTDKIGPRGPVGVEGLLTYRWLLTGDGHAAGDYRVGGRRFVHRDLD